VNKKWFYCGHLHNICLVCWNPSNNAFNFKMKFRWYWKRDREASGIISVIIELWYIYLVSYFPGVFVVNSVLCVVQASLPNTNQNYLWILQEPNKIYTSLKRLPLTMQCLHTGGLYLLDDGFNFIVWLGRMLPPELVSNILGVSLANFPDLSKVHLSYSVMILAKDCIPLFS